MYKPPTRISKEPPVKDTTADEPIGDISDMASETDDTTPDEPTDKYAEMMADCSAEDLHHIIELANTKLQEMNQNEETSEGEKE